MRVPMAVSVSLAESLSVFLAVAVVGRRGGVRAVLAGLGESTARSSQGPW